jgi:hypothetical protein
VFSCTLLIPGTRPISRCCSDFLSASRMYDMWSGPSVNR